MVKLDFSVLGFAYESGLECLRDSFSAAVQGIRNQMREETEAWRSGTGEYREPIKFTDDGDVIFDPSDVYQFKMEAVAEAHAELRKAFAIAIYHYWERNIRVFCTLPNGKHAELEAAAATLGVQLPPDFTRVHRLANALKHNNRASVRALHREWPEVSGVWMEVAGDRDWYAGIELTDDHIHYLLDLTKLAGPSIRARQRVSTDAVATALDSA